MSTAVNAERINKNVTVNTYLPADQFWVTDRDGNSVQVRLEPNGNVLLYYRRNYHTVEYRAIAFAEFIVMFQRFVDKMKS